MKSEKKLFATAETQIIQGETLKLEIVGDHPLAKDDQGNLKSRIGTIFTNNNTLITIPGIHATQRMAYIDRLNRKRRKIGIDPLSDEEESNELKSSVDLIMEGNEVLIRPDPDNMIIAFKADEILQEIVSKQHVKFLYVANKQVKDAIKWRGEYWRISPLPKSPEEMMQMISTSRIGISGQPIYYYNKAKGTKILTFDEFSRLGALDDKELRKYLGEIKQYGCCCNRLENPEMAFFMADKAFSCSSFVSKDFNKLDPVELRKIYEELKKRFWDVVPPEFRVDDPSNTEWRNRIFTVLTEQKEGVVSEEQIAGLSSEFFMQIEWLPGARFEQGELIFDPVFEEQAKKPGDPVLEKLCDEKSRGFIFSFVREYGDLEYVNIGRMGKSLSKRTASVGRRDVYIAEIKHGKSEKETVRILRMQKWGVHERLDEGKSLLDAIIESEEYNDYILDRRLGCRQLGMNLPHRVISRTIAERYYGNRREYHGITIWSPYFERDYIYGTATDKTPVFKYRDESYALKYAHLLGCAAAPNMIVGRTGLDGGVVFDDGDEVILEDKDGMPVDLVVADHTGTFTDYQSDLHSFAADYAKPVVRRGELLSDSKEFTHVYLLAFVERFSRIQQEYKKRKRAFDSLFKGKRRDERGSFAYRWERVLDRLNRADPLRLQELIRKHISTV
ncbi:MAG: hypothetical protein A2283_18680 [Lentisphaerae bacterium RIFOXYA12_FULL_48_11]|nr:MAG: hypothetical protein A2283_18680 [Lentisphaerae bacterium RIFOXYA12_FULL_48_11]